METALISDIVCCAGFGAFWQPNRPDRTAKSPITATAFLKNLLYIIPIQGMPHFVPKHGYLSSFTSAKMLTPFRWIDKNLRNLPDMRKCTHSGLLSAGFSCLFHTGIAANGKAKRPCYSIK